MYSTAKVVSLLALAATIGPSLVYFVGGIDHSTVKMATLVGTIVWFIATPMWMSRKLPVDAKHVEI